MHVSTGRVEQIHASNDRGDALGGVVEHDGQVVGGQAVAAPDDVIPRHRGYVGRDRSLNSVDEGDRSRLNAHADGGGGIVLGALAAGAGVTAALGDVRGAHRAAGAATEERETSA